MRFPRRLYSPLAVATATLLAACGESLGPGEIKGLPRALTQAEIQTDMITPVAP